MGKKIKKEEKDCVIMLVEDQPFENDKYVIRGLLEEETVYKISIIKVNRSKIPTSLDKVYSISI
jgi:hypothetical protein